MNLSQMGQMHATNLYRAALISKSFSEKNMWKPKSTLYISTNRDICILKVSLLLINDRSTDQTS